MSKFIKLFFMLIIFVCLLGLFIAAFYMFSSGNEEQKNIEKIKRPIPLLQRELNIKDSINPIYHLKPFLFQTKNGKNVTIKIDFEISLKELKYELITQNKKIVQIIKNILETKTIDGIYTLDGKNKIEIEIKKALNTFLVDGKIVNVYIISARI